jgi:hypothetical protein
MQYGFMAAEHLLFGMTFGLWNENDELRDYLNRGQSLTLLELCCLCADTA